MKMTRNDSDSEYDLDGNRFRKLRVALLPLKILFMLVIALYVLFLVSTPFRPVAIQPPPADLVARYVPELRVPWHEGTAARMLLGFTHPDEHESMGITNAIVIEGWHDHWQKFMDGPVSENHSGSARDLLRGETRTNSWNVVINGTSVDETLDALLPAVEAFADAAQADDDHYNRLFNEQSLLEELPDFKPILYLLPAESVRQTDRGNVEAAVTAIKRHIRIGEYMLRGEKLLDYLVGSLLTQKATRMALRLAETSNGLEPTTATNLNEFFSIAANNVPETTKFIYGEMINSTIPMVRNFYSKKNTTRFVENVFIFWNPWLTNKFVRNNNAWNSFISLVGSSFLLGNDRTGVMRALENAGQWSAVLAGAEHDQYGPDMNELYSQASNAFNPGSKGFLRRGWIAVAFVPVFNSYHSKTAFARANLASAQTALMLSAFRREEGREPVSLKEVESRFGWTAPSQPFTRRKMDYTRLEPPSDAVDGASAYAIASWADGRLIKEGGGSVWLVVRNPAFGSLPFRIYQWISAGGDKGGLQSNQIEVTEELQSDVKRGDIAPKLLVPADLFRGDPQKWDTAEQYMHDAGWSL